MLIFKKLRLTEKVDKEIIAYVKKRDFSTYLIFSTTGFIIISTTILAYSEILSLALIQLALKFWKIQLTTEINQSIELLTNIMIATFIALIVSGIGHQELWKKLQPLAREGARNVAEMEG